MSQSSLSDKRSNAQLRTLRIFRGLSKYELLHLINEAGLDLNIYDTHDRRACGMLTEFYRGEGLMLRVQWAVTRRFVKN